MKKNINLLLNLLIINLTLLSCEGTSSNKNKTIKNVEEEQHKIETVLNVNLVSESDLISLGFSKDLVNRVLLNQPYLNFSDFLSIFNEFDKESLFKKVFLPLNLNTANETDFKMIPGVGDKMAHEFEEYRPYLSIDEFRREIGKYVDEREVFRYLNYVFVPVELNTCRERDIKSLPGVGNKMAHEFIEYRPYLNINQFRRNIGKYVDEKELKRLERFVYLK
tara:strand:+ start:53 stop:715 length:663 start_codon:yes stop_codon:yes gene_type:complete